MVHVAVVLYRQNQEELIRCVESCLGTPLVSKLYLFDNSPTDDLKTLSEIDPRIEYHFNNGNLGFGKAHNLAIKKVLVSDAAYHLVLNPDVWFESSVIERLVQFMGENQDMVNVMPKILYPDKQLQRLGKMLPSPMQLFGRRFMPFYRKRANERYEMMTYAYDRILDVPNLSGCFMFIRVEGLRRVGGFDERFFMYLEDVDLNRRLGSIGRTVIFPFVEIFHAYRKASYERGKLAHIHMQSAIKYFNKWGWFLDRQRSERNAKVDVALVADS